MSVSGSVSALNGVRFAKFSPIRSLTVLLPYGPGSPLASSPSISSFVDDYMYVSPTWWDGWLAGGWVWHGDPPHHRLQQPMLVISHEQGKSECIWRSVQSMTDILSHPARHHQPHLMPLLRFPGRSKTGNRILDILRAYIHMNANDIDSGSSIESQADQELHHGCQSMSDACRPPARRRRRRRPTTLLVRDWFIDSIWRLTLASFPGSLTDLMRVSPMFGDVKKRTRLSASPIREPCTLTILSLIL